MDSDEGLFVDRFFVNAVLDDSWAEPEHYVYVSRGKEGGNAQVVPGIGSPNEWFAYDEPAEDELVLYDLDKSPVQQQEAYEYVEHGQEVTEQRVPSFEMPVASSFDPVDHFEFVPADPQPSTSKAATGWDSGSRQTNENTAVGMTSSKPEKNKSRPRVARKRGVQQRNAGDLHDGKRLYAFTHRLLSDPNFEHVVRWLDELNGMWQVVDSKEYARLWGIHKNNPNMTYKILGRALRYLKQWKILEKHGPRNLVFQFTPAFRCLTPLLHSASLRF